MMTVRRKKIIVILEGGEPLHINISGDDVGQRRDAVIIKLVHLAYTVIRPISSQERNTLNILAAHLMARLPPLFQIQFY